MVRIRQKSVISFILWLCKYTSFAQMRSICVNLREFDLQGPSSERDEWVRFMVTHGGTARGRVAFGLATTYLRQPMFCSLGVLAMVYLLICGLARLAHLG